MSVPDEEFDVLGEDKLVLLKRRFERLHENRVNMRRDTRTCFQCGKPRHFVANCPETTSTSRRRMASTDQGAITSTSSRARIRTSDDRGRTRVEARPERWLE
jgi:hypothetical protein